MKSANDSAAPKLTLVRPAARSREEIEFLPAALEIVESPPSPTGRIFVYAIALFFALALAWAAFGQVDIVAVAPGRIVPTGRSKVIQPLETAIVKAIHVRDGQTVRAGDTLIELDTTASIAESRRLTGDLQAARLDIARLRAALGEDGDALIRFQPPSDIDTGLVAVQRQLLASQMSSHAAKVAGIDRQMQQRLAEQATIGATIAKLQATIPLIRERYEIRDEMARKQLGSKIALLESMQALVESEKELVVQRSQLTTAEAAAAVLSETRAEAVAEFRRVATAELAEAERKAASLQEELIKAEQRTKLLSLIAPIDGTVQQLAINTVGGVVTSAQTLLVLVPSVSRIEIEAMISNRDIGFVRVGQDVEVKIDAFDFTRYGLVRGKVDSISRDAVTRNGPGDRDAERGRGGEPRPADEKGQEMAFAARIILERAQLDVDGALVDLAPGMAANAEIKTGMRSVLSFLMSPIARYRQSTLRER